MLSKSKDRLSLWVLVLILILQGVALRDELTVSRRDANDNVDHYLIAQGIANAVEHGGNPLDWFTECPFGYPVIRNYQPLAHLLVVLLYFALGKSISLMAAFAIVRFLSLALLPLSFFACARLMDFPRWTAVGAAALSPLIVTHGLFGLEYGSYVWESYGLFTQAVAVNLLLVALGLGFRGLRRGRGLAPAGLILGLTFVCHFIYGYIGAVSICLLALLPDVDVPRRRKIERTVVIGAVAFVVALFQLLPLWLDGALISPAHRESAWKTDSFGAPTVLKLLFSGEILDYGRLPILSLLVLAGIAAIGWRFRKTRRITAAEVFAGAGALFWLLVFFGRATWGPLMWLLGLPHDFHIHRVIGGLQIFLVLLAAVGLAAVWRAVAFRMGAIAAGAAVLVLLLPAMYERVSDLNTSAADRNKHLELIQADKPALDASVSLLRQRGGNVYAGLSTNWGKIFVLGGAPIYAYLTTNDLSQTSFSYHAIELSADMLARFDEMQPSQYRLFNVRSMLAPADMASHVPGFLRPILTVGHLAVFEAPGSGYFDVVDALAAVPADRQSFYPIDDRWLHSDLVARRGHLLLDFFHNAPAGLPRMDPDGGLPDDAYPAPPGEVASERRTGDVFQATVNAVRPAYAMFRMSWHQNWKATLDGQPAQTFMLSPGFIGVPVTAGTHNMEFRYQPDRWRVPLALGGLLVALLLVAAEQSGKLRFPQTEIAVPTEPEPELEPAKATETAHPGRAAKTRRAGTKARR